MNLNPVALAVQVFLANYCAPRPESKEVSDYKRILNELGAHLIKHGYAWSYWNTAQRP